MISLYATRYLLLAGAIVFAVFSTGCRMSVDNGDGKEKVEIKTPLGQLKVNTDVDVRDTGMSVYPGAKEYQDGDNNDRHGANVNISSGLFGVKVVVKEFRSDAKFDQVRDYYRNELKRYGNVLECSGVYDQNVHADKDDDNAPLSCDDGKGDRDALQLKAGTKRRQHVVGIKPDGNGTRFALVYVNVRGKDEGI